MISDDDIRHMEQTPAKILEPSYAERQDKIARRILDVDGFVRAFKNDFIELALEPYPAEREAQAVKKSPWNR
jgi:hypothetical protein